MKIDTLSSQQSLKRQSLKKHSRRTGRYLLQFLFCITVGLGITIMTALCRRYSIMGSEQQSTIAQATMKVLQLG